MKKKLIPAALLQKKMKWEVKSRKPWVRTESRQEVAVNHLYTLRKENISSQKP